MQPHIVVTVVGRDGPGIIARATGLLAGLRMNLEDSSMTRLRGHFAMTLVCSGAAEIASVERALTPLADDELDVTVRPGLTGRAEAQVAGSEAWLVSVHGADRLGIVAEVAGVVAEHRGNITDLTTRLSGELYVLTAEVDLPPGGGERLREALQATTEALGVHVALEPLVDDEL